MMNAPDVPRSNFFAMTFLDVNRAKSLYASHMSLPVDKIKDEDVIIWGNHSNTMVVDFRAAEAAEKAGDLTALKQRIQKRGAEIIKARGFSSAASAANAILDNMKAIITPGKFFSAGVVSDG